MDINDYIGIPWLCGHHTRQGADCWGLVTMVMEEVYGVIVNRHKGSTATGSELADIIESEERNGPWSRCAAQEGAIVIMIDRATRRPEHVGICISPDDVLHSIAATPNGASSVTRLDVIRRAFYEVRFYRYADDPR
jgi:cell wall-associated NlpC family hydrolase